MSLFRRITTTVTSSVDKAVSKVENHDAIINAALRDTQQAAARARASDTGSRNPTSAR